MALLADLVAAIDTVRSLQPRVLVGIDGPDAAGKTMLADGLAEEVRGPVLRATVDDFQRPSSARHRRGALSADGYYEDAFDRDTLAADLLGPFRAGAARVRVTSHDYARDLPHTSYADVPEAAVLLVDGVFLQHEALRPFWSLVVYLRVTEQTALARGVARDLSRFPDEASARRAYVERYLAAQARYRREVDPESCANVLVDNEDPSAPVLLRRPSG